MLYKSIDYIAWCFVFLRQLEVKLAGLDLDASDSFWPNGYEDSDGFLGHGRRARAEKRNLGFCTSSYIFTFQASFSLHSIYACGGEMWSNSSRCFMRFKTWRTSMFFLRRNGMSHVKFSTLASPHRSLNHLKPTWLRTNVPVCKSSHVFHIAKKPSPTFLGGQCEGLYCY